MSQWTWKQSVAEQVLHIVNSRKSPHFNLDDVYRREHILQQRFPRNQHVREKIRQTLQRLRDMGFMRFEGEAQYSLNLQFDELELDNAAPEEEGIAIPETKTVVRNIRLRNTLLASEIKRRYDQRCQVCREAIPLKDRDYAESRHVKPLGSPHYGPDTEGNIIVVCPNHHVMFDRGALCIDPASFMVVHISNAMETRPLVLQKWHVLNPRYLRYHSRHIYGKV